MMLQPGSVAHHTTAGLDTVCHITAPALPLPTFCPQLLDQLDVVGRTSELARAFGIDFFSVLVRGSQYRVESLMARLARSQVCGGLLE